jgi:hypothetical protein
MEDSDLLVPDRGRSDIEWSVALSQAEAARDRFVVYGMGRPEMLRYLTLRGVDGEALFTSLLDDHGPPFQVAVGQDGPRTKAYWFLESADPAFFGVDCRDGQPAGHKRYRLLEAAEVSTVLDPRLHETVRWLLARPEFHGDRLLHLVALRRGQEDRYSGVHVGFSPDWLGLIRGDTGLLQRNLVEEFLLRLGLQRHLSVVSEAVLEAPMAWTCYLSVLIRGDGSLGANIYARSNPVEWRDGGCWLTEPGRGGVVPRPVVLTWTLSDEPDVRVRMRWFGDDPCFFEVAGWRIEYRSDESDDALRERGVFERMERVAREGALGGGPGEPTSCLARLVEHPEVRDARLGPDMRYSPA